MLKLIPFELRKLFTKKLFIGILACLLVANTFMLWYANRPGEETAPLAAYRLLGETLRGLTNEDRLAYITEYHNTINGVALVERVQSYEAQQSEQGYQLAENLKNRDSDAYQRYYAMWKSGNYLRFTQTIQQEKSFAAEIYQEISALAGYAGFLSDIQSKSNTLSDISIFSKDTSDGYSARNIEKTARDYAKMEYTPIRYDVSHGVVSAISFLATDCAVFLFLFVFAFIMMYEEKSRNLYAFIKPTPRGRAATMGAKLSALAVYTAVITLLLYGGNLLYFHCTTGLGDLNRSIQSIGIFMGSTLNLSVLQFLLCFLLLKWLACFTIGLLVLFASTLFRKLPSAFGLCAALLLGSFALYTLIPDNSNITLLKHINLFGLFRVQDMLGQYLNLNVFGYPVSLFSLRLIVMLVLTTAFAAASVAIFGMARKAHAPRPQISVFRRHIPGFTPGKSVWKNELYKALWINKAGIALAAYLCIMLYGMANTSVYLPPDEILYQSYMQRLEGPVTQEKADFLEEERLRFESVQAQLEDIDAQLDAGTLTDVQALEKRLPLEREAFRAQGFERVWSQYLYLKDTPDAQFVYEGGYHALFGLSENSDGMEYPAICIMLILCCHVLFSTEYASGSSKLLAATPLGRRYLSKRKLWIGLLFTLAIFTLGVLPGVLTALEAYGLPALSAPLRSLTIYAAAPPYIRIGVFLLLCLGLKLLACLAVALVVMAISKAVRNHLYALLLCAVSISLPILLHAMGLEWAGYASLIPLYSAGAWLAGGQTPQLVVYTAAALTITGFCTYFSIHGKKRC